MGYILFRIVLGLLTLNTMLMGLFSTCGKVVELIQNFTKPLRFSKVSFVLDLLDGL